MNTVLRVEKMIAEWRADLDARGIVITDDNPKLSHERRLEEMVMARLRVEAMRFQSIQNILRDRGT